MKQEEPYPRENRPNWVALNEKTSLLNSPESNRKYSNEIPKKYPTQSALSFSMKNSQKIKYISLCPRIKTPSHTGTLPRHNMTSYYRTMRSLKHRAAATKIKQQNTNNNKFYEPKLWLRVCDVKSIHITERESLML